MRNNFCESQLEEATLEWFQELGYDIAFGPEISPEGDYPEREDYSEVILAERIRQALAEFNPELPEDAIEEAYRKIAVPQSPSLVMNNKTFQKMITDGIEVSYRQKDGTIRHVLAKVFDFVHWDRNDFLAVNQYTIIENRIEKRPDVVVFVNGIPLVVIELKSAINEDVDISDAYNQLQTYKMSIPHYLHTIHLW